MTSRERLATTLAHRQPDRVPVDFGSTAVTGMHVTCVAALREHYGLDRRPVRVHEPYQMLGLIEDDLLDAMGVDTVGLHGYRTIFGFSNEDWRPFRLPWGQEVLVSTRFQVSERVDGALLLYPRGDTCAPPSAVMPAGGFFFDTIIRQEPIDEERLDPADNLEEFGPIEAEERAYLETERRRLAAGERAVVAGLPGTGLGDIALVTAPFLRHPRGIRDVEEWYVSTAMRPDYIRRVFERQTEIALENLPVLAAAMGDLPLVVLVCGTDFGTQTSTFCSVAAFDELYAPFYRMLNDRIHRDTKWKTMKHSCGAVAPFLSRFAAAGFDVINPVQCSATGMDPRELKARHGDRLVFWGGGIDTQHVLPFGTPEDVRRQVLERCEIFAPGGGFVFNAIHNVQAKTPVANIVAMLDAVREFNGGAASATGAYV